MSYTFPVTRTTHPKPKPDQSNLGFGKYFTDVYKRQVWTRRACT